MKHPATALFVSFLLLCPASSLANYLGDIVLDKGDVADLGFGTPVEVTFSYKIDEVEGARIRVLPYVDGGLHPGGVYQNPLVYPQGSGTGWTQCAVFSGDPVVDQIVVQMLDATQYEILLELAIPVNYRYSWIGVFDIGMSPASPGWFAHDDTLSIGFNYNNTWPGPVRIYARPFCDGELCDGYSASASPAYPQGTGSGTGTLTFPVLPADVDAIRFQVWTDDDPPTLQNQFFVPVDFHWGEHGLKNFHLNVDSIAYMAHEEHAICTFDYSTTDPDGVRIWAFGGRDGSIVWEGVGNQGSAAEPPPGGHLSRYFFYEIDQDLDAVAILMRDALQAHTYIEAHIPLDLKYRAHVVKEPVFTPGAPAILDSGEHISVEFAYATTGEDPVLIFPHPYAQGEDVLWACSPSPLYYPPDGYGSCYTYSGYSGNPRLVDQIMFDIEDYDTYENLEEIFYPALHWYGHSAVATAAPEDVPGAATRILSNFPNPFNPSTTLRFTLAEGGPVELAIYDVRGHRVRTLCAESLEAGAHSLSWDGRDSEGRPLASGVYLSRLVAGEQVRTRKMMLMK